MIQIVITACVVLIVAHTLQIRRLRLYAKRRRATGIRYDAMFKSSREAHIQWLSKKNEDRRIEKARKRAMESLKS